MSKTKKNQNPSLSQAEANDRGAEGADGLPPSVEPPSEASSVDKIRDIIFGNQMRDYEKRFDGLEERLANAIQNLRDETDKRLDSIENYIKQEVDSFSERLKGESNARTEAFTKISEELSDLGRTFSRKVEQLTEKQNQDTRDLRAQLLEQTKTLSQEIRDKQHAASQALDQAVGQLRDAKLDRAFFAELLVEMAVRMSNELADKINPATND